MLTKEMYQHSRVRPDSITLFFLLFTVNSQWVVPLGIIYGHSESFCQLSSALKGFWVTWFDCPYKIFSENVTSVSSSGAQKMILADSDAIKHVCVFLWAAQWHRVSILVLNLPAASKCLAKLQIGMLGLSLHSSRTSLLWIESVLKTFFS